MSAATPDAPPRCEECGKPLPPPGRRGPKRRYHSYCKQRASRARRAQTPTIPTPTTSPETTP